MTIIVTGGGSGGHITPILAVAHELKRADPTIRIIYIGQKGDGLSDIPANSPDIDKVLSIRAGKFRRYHGEGLRQVFDVPTMLKNIRDAALVVIGLFQSLRILKVTKPSVIFIKGGFVGVPIGLAAAWHKIPYVTHDSDALPGLANRLIARWASIHAVALPKETYSYPSTKTITVGVPVQADFVKVTDKIMREEKAKLGVAPAERVVLITGGGLGALVINQGFASISKQLLEKYDDLRVFHLVGRLNEAEMVKEYDELLNADTRQRVTVIGYTSQLYRYSAAADVVIARAGATNLAEFAVQHKACIIIPNPVLTGGHQIKNAELLVGAGAIRLVSEDALRAEPVALKTAVMDLLDSEKTRRELGQNLGEFARLDSAGRLADIILKTARRPGVKV